MNAVQDVGTRERIVAVMDMTLAERGLDQTVCPSEIARWIAGSDDHGWRTWMSSVRHVAGELAAAGVVEITQDGTRVDIHAARGPVRVGRPGGRFR